jgi:pyruvate, water dikinase
VKYIYWLSQIQDREQFLVGDKLYILSQLLRHECPILPGFVLGHNLWRQFLTTAGIELSELLTNGHAQREVALRGEPPLSPKGLLTLKGISAGVSFRTPSDKDTASRRKLPKKAPSSYGGVHVTENLADNLANNYQTLQTVVNLGCQRVNQANFAEKWQTEIFQAAQQLNSATLILQPIVHLQGRHRQAESLWRSHTCNNHPEALSTAIKLVWSELFSAHSLLYWHKQGIDIAQVNLSILVRPLKNASASGIVEIRDDMIHLKANWGLEPSLLQGEVEPDRYELDLDTGSILFKHLGHKNYSYRVKEIDLQTPQFDCLESYIPADDLASTYVLTDEAIAHLLELVLNVLEQQPQIKYLTWTALELEYFPSPDFYFTWLDDYLTTTVLETITQKASPSSTKPLHLVSGIAASSGTAKGKVVLIKDFATYSGSIPPGSILVTKVIEPQHIALIRQASGIITEIGGKASHGAIVARELNIPAIVNATKATEILHHGDRVWLNGDNGKVYAANEHSFGQHQPRLLNLNGTPAYPIATKLMVNLSQPESIATAAKLPTDGIGLLRSELMLADLLSSKTFARWQESFREEFLSTLTDSLRQFVVAFAPRPVFYRSLDRYENSKNPVSSSRGTYGYLNDPNSLFELELEALASILAEGDRNLNLNVNLNVNLILPFVRSVEEFNYCYRQIEKAGLTAKSSFQVWIMVEVPSAILLLPEYIRAGVQGIAIGTNDLTQLLLGVSREQVQFNDRGLNANHPAMQKAIAKIIKIAKVNQIECCICGQAPVEYPSLIDLLVEWGIDAISVEPAAVNRTYRAIARAEKRMMFR